AAGNEHSLALKSDGTVWAWGVTYYGQMFDHQARTVRPTPTQVPGLTGVVALREGGWHWLALKSDGTVWAWGQNHEGQLGDGTFTPRPTPAQVPGLTGVEVLAAGGEHSLALKSDGALWTWGSNFHGQFGNGSSGVLLSPVRVW
ncbi:RCC1 domain-containing protein, partial [Pyxidicoccus sp. 3LG]